MAGRNIENTYATTGLGLGYRHALSNVTDVYGVVSMVDFKLTASSSTDEVSTSEKGEDITIGLRSMVEPEVELGAAVNYVSVDSESEIGFTGSATFFFSESFNVGMSLGRLDKSTTLALSTGFYF